MKVLYRGDFTSPSGYSRAARSHAKALIDAGVDVLFEMHKCDVNDIPLDDWWSTELPARMQRHELAPIKIWHETPEFYAPTPTHINVAMLDWETTGIPSWDVNNNPRHNWVKQLNKMDLVWVFCEAAKKALLDSGVQTPVKVIPHPIDNEIYYPKTPENTEFLYDSNKKALDDDWFRMGAVFQWTSRKDPLSLLIAYYSEFKPEDKVVLILKTYTGKSGDVEAIRQQILSIKQSVRLPYQHSRVLLVPGTLSDAEMGHLIRSCDVMVHSSHGEGFCLPAAEAMACGVPNIAPNGSAYLDYNNELNGYPVDVTYSPVVGMKHIPWYYATQEWHTVQMPSLRARMREAYEERMGVVDRGQQAIKSVRRFWPDRVGEQMRTTLENLLERSRSQKSRSVPTPA